MAMKRSNFGSALKKGLRKFKRREKKKMVSAKEPLVIKPRKGESMEEAAVRQSLPKGVTAIPLEKPVSKKTKDSIRKATGEDPDKQLAKLRRANRRARAKKNKQG